MGDYLQIHNPQFEQDETIQTFGETKGDSVSPEEVKNAEDAIEEEQDESTPTDGFDDVELSAMNDRQILQLRFTPKMDYGTPSGGEDTGCPNCGNADAGDIAIIDSEIAPTEGTTEEDTFGNDSSEAGIGDEIAMYARLQEAYRYHQGNPSSDHPVYIASMEGFTDVIGELIGVMKTLMIKVTKYARKTYLFIRKKISATFMRLQTVQKLWSYKLSKHLDKVDVERLGEYEIEAFPYDIWIDAAKLSLMSFEMVQNADRIVFEHGDDAVTNTMSRFKEKLGHSGVSINVSKNRINVDGLLDTRRYESVLSHGYTKSQIPNCIRYLGEIAKRVPKGKENNLEHITNKVIERVTMFAAQTNEAVEEGRLSKNSQEYKDVADKLMNYTVRLDFILTCMRCSYALFDMLTKDMLTVFSKYEDAMTKSDFV